ncbi:MAG: hypothetical protein M9888_02430 [Chitinophagales bacterium]|nr:hypothetical protein [Chitinophagales bacterium]
MRKIFFVLLSAVLLIACKKSKVCVKCIEYDDIDYGITTYCLGEDWVETEEMMNKLIQELEGDGYIVNHTERCK